MAWIRHHLRISLEYDPALAVGRVAVVGFMHVAHISAE